MLNVKKTLTKILQMVPYTESVGELQGHIRIGKFRLMWNTNTQSVSSSQPATWTSSFGAVAFAYKPVVFTQIIETTAPHIFHVSVENITTTECTFRRTSTSATSYNCTILWLAVGIRS